MEKQTVLIGMYRHEDIKLYCFYFRDARGFKHRISSYEESSGVKDLYMCCGAPMITPEEYNSLPYQIKDGEKD
jgi:hypothetical protein